MTDAERIPEQIIAVAEIIMMETKERCSSSLNFDAINAISAIAITLKMIDVLLVEVVKKSIAMKIRNRIQKAIFLIGSRLIVFLLYK